MDKIYDTFFLNNERFTVEDYDTNLFGIYHEDMFVGTCKEPTTKCAMNVALDYYMGYRK